MAQLTFNPDTPNAWVSVLKEGENTLGRSEDNDVRVEEGGVSGYHCRISVEQGLVTITDLNSTNGTHINGARISQSGWAPGQIVFLGHLPVRLDARVSAVPSPALGAPGANGGSAVARPLTPAVSLSSPRLRIAGHAPANETVSSPEPGTESAPPVAGPAFISAPPGTRCRSHNKSLASWSCPKCRKYFCDLCVATRATASGPAHMCRGCGVECLPVRMEFVMEQERGFFSRLPGAFVFPFKGAGVLILIVATMLFAAFSAMSGIFSILLTMAATGYLFLFLQNIIHGAANAEETMPSLPDMDGLFGAFFTLAGTVIISFILPIGLGIAKFFDVDIPTSALVASVFASLFYFPMAFLAVAILDSPAAANPLVVVPSILKVPAHYLVTVLILCAVFGVRILGGMAAVVASDATYTTTDMSVFFGVVAARAIWSFISLYLLTVAIRILGLLYLTQKDKLGWL
jgi:hypothetical protein